MVALADDALVAVQFAAECVLTAREEEEHSESNWLVYELERSMARDGRLVGGPTRQVRCRAMVSKTAASRLRCAATLFGRSVRQSRRGWVDGKARSRGRTSLLDSIELGKSDEGMVRRMELMGWRSRLRVRRGRRNALGPSELAWVWLGDGWEGIDCPAASSWGGDAVVVGPLDTQRCSDPENVRRVTVMSRLVWGSF